MSLTTANEKMSNLSIDHHPASVDLNCGIPTADTPVPEAMPPKSHADYLAKTSDVSQLVKNPLLFLVENVFNNRPINSKNLAPHTQALPS